MVDDKSLYIHVCGDRACFTRPEFAVERLTYPVMTPSAAAGLLKAVYWKPECSYMIRSIAVLNEIRTESIRRNEISKKGSVSAIIERMNGGDGKGNINRNEKGVATPMTTTYLTNVAYVIEARVVVPEHAGWVSDDYHREFNKHREMLTRRLEKGQFYSSPYLGKREFRVDCTLLKGREEVPRSFYAGQTEDMGYVLHHINYPDTPHFRSDLEPEAPVFWHAVMEDGWIDCDMEGVSGL